MQAHFSRGVTSLSPGPRGFAQGLCKPTTSNGKAGAGKSRGHVNDSTAAPASHSSILSGLPRTPPHARSLLTEPGLGSTGWASWAHRTGAGHTLTPWVPEGGLRELSVAPRVGAGFREAQPLLPTGLRADKPLPLLLFSKARVYSPREELRINCQRRLSAHRALLCSQSGPGETLPTWHRNPGHGFPFPTPGPLP